MNVLLTPTTTGNAILDAALMYASQGAHVFPVNPKTKIPHIKDWPNAATTDHQQIIAWWKQWPKAMIGGATGERSCFFALDIDNRPSQGKDGFASLAGLVAIHGGWPSTYRSRSPSTGEHQFFNYPESTRIRNSASEIAPGLDIRGGRADGASTGFVLLPPSIRADGKSYQSIEGCDAIFDIGTPRGLPDAPAWFLFLVIFSKRQRDEYAKVGIKGAEFFGDAHPSEWVRLADEACGKAWGGKQFVLGQPLDTDSADRVVNYVSAGINRELEAIANTGDGEQERTMNNAGLAIHSLLSGARIRGVDPQVVADIEAKAKENYCKAVTSMRAFKIEEPWTLEHALDKWDDTKDDAEPRNLWRIGATDADKEFSDCVPITESTPASEIFEYASDNTLEDILALSSGALVKGLLKPGETAMMYGQTTTGKSFVALDMSWHVALGIDRWHGLRVKRACVLYVCLEGVSGFKARMFTYKRELGDPGNYFARLRMPISLVRGGAGEPGTVHVIDAAKKLMKETAAERCLIVIDTAARAMAGDSDTDTKDMMAFVEGRVGRIARETGAAVLVVHHANAAGEVKGNRALGQAVDTTLRAERDGDMRTLIAEKVKDGKEGPLFSFTLETVPLGTDEDGDEVSSCVVRWAPPPATRPQKLTLRQQLFIEAYNRAIAAGHFINTPSGIPDGPLLVQADERAVQDEFNKGYPKANASAETKARQWRRARKAVAGQFEFGVSGGVAQVWRNPILDPGERGG